MTGAPIRRIAISTGGGDAPGLNAVIRATVSAALRRGWECVGIRDGYNGLLVPERYPQGGLVPLTHERVRGISHLGGTILGTTNKGDPFHFPVRNPDGSMGERDRSDELVACFAQNGIDALITVGGDGSLSIAHELHRKGLRVVGVPKTIDNDLDKTFTTFGFDTAVSFATECLDRLHSTAESHQRIMVVEMMGRYAGWIALHAGIAGGAHAILLPEIPFDLAGVVDQIQARDALGRMYSLVVVAEGASDGFWSEQAQLVDWQTPPQQICDYSNPPFAKWFVGGTTNLCHNAVDRHLWTAPTSRADFCLHRDRPGKGLHLPRTAHRGAAHGRRAEGPGRAKGRPRPDLHADDPRGRVCHAGLHPHRRHPLGGVRRLCLRRAGLAHRRLRAPRVIVSADGGMRGGKAVEYKPLLDEAIRLSATNPRPCCWSTARSRPCPW
jgi:6-phosphofructokinase